MKLTPSERWILANQYRLLQLLSAKPSPLYQHAIVILESGYEDKYEYAAQYLREEPFPQDIAAEVRDILRMFEEIQWALEDLPDEDPLQRDDRTLFDGFDGNNDYQHLAYASFLHSLDEYPDLGKRLRFNSHSSISLQRYRAMLAVWKQNPRQGMLMNRDDILAVLDAPSQRKTDAS